MAKKPLPKMYVNKELVSYIEVSEIDFDLYGEFGFDYDTHSSFIEIPIGGDVYTDAHPINIDRMIKILTRMKSKGATHVEIDYHADHIGYMISGFEITPSKQKDIEVFEAEDLARQAKNEKIKKLYDEIVKLQNQK